MKGGLFHLINSAGRRLMINIQQFKQCPFLSGFFYMEFSLLFITAIQISTTVNIVYKGLGYREFLAIANNFSCTNHFHPYSTLYVYYELRLQQTYFQCPVMLVITGSYCIIFSLQKSLVKVAGDVSVILLQYTYHLEVWRLGFTQNNGQFTLFYF